MVPFHATIFMASPEETILSNSVLKPIVWWCYIDHIIMVWEYGEEEIKKVFRDS